jgi:hypothetical protein
MEDLILYHATDARVVKFSKEDRIKITNFCKRLIKALSPLYQDGDYGRTILSKIKEVVGDDYTYHDITSAYQSTVAMSVGAEDFQYGDFYLERKGYSLIRYAYQAKCFGEIGFTAYNLWLGATALLGKELDIDNKDAHLFETIFDLAADSPEPVIYKFNAFKDFDTKYLLAETGEHINFEAKFHCSSFRYKKEIDLNDYEAIPIKDWIINQITEKDKDNYVKKYNYYFYPDVIE